MKKLWQSYEMKGKMIPNRLVFPPMASEKSCEDGSPSKEMVEHYQKYAASGVGTLIVEHAFIDDQGKFSPKQLSMAEDRFVESHSKIANMIKAHQILSSQQINHGGAHVLPSTGKTTALGPSNIRLNPGEMKVEPMSVDDIHATIEHFADAAGRVSKSGYDMVEIHAAHGFLLSQFLSPITNHRTDCYGGNLNSRMKMLVEVVEAVRARISEETLLAVRLGIADCPPFVEGREGLTLEEGIQVARVLQEKNIDILDISGGLCGSRPSSVEGEAYYLPFSKAVKEAGISLPLIITGGISSIDIAEDIVERGFSDFVGIGRALFHDPLWLLKQRQQH